MTRSSAITGGLLLVITAVMILVLAGVGQGSPPHALPISHVAVVREIAAVEHGSSLVKQGEALFDAHGCDDCHTMAAGGYSGTIGPRLDVITQQDPLRDVQGSIIDPPDDDQGYESNLMPENYGDRLTRHDIHALAVYIHTAAQAARGTHKKSASS